MKRILSILLTAAALLAAGPHAGAAEVSAEAAILLEATTGTVLYEKEADRRLPMASTTKIMTALVALETLDPAASVRIPEEVCGVEGSGIGLRPGEVLTVEDLLWAVLLESANDASEAVALAAAGSVEAFAGLMNGKAEALGLRDTHFVNPHGLDDEEHYTTARDLAKLTVAAMAYPRFREMVRTREHRIAREGGLRSLVNHNRLLRMSEDAVGVKTGFTRRSGRCLVSAAERDGAALVCVTLNAPDDWNDHLSLYEEGFSRTKAVTLASPGQFSASLPCPWAKDGAVRIANPGSLTRIFFDRVPEITAAVEAKRLLLEPVTEGETLGEVVFRAEGEVLASLPLTALESAAPPEKEPSFFSRFFHRPRRS